ncbi:YdeI/OmpD-associated family protein [Pedobacter gandavensis]|uniref:YdeI/OmpD-associated family protein n=1 Tax=Pedobacter gandavensis TaxID=2679963 RepID=UPI0029310E38|nr:YdeI/OmpD-associated family protein [Pedobacter gandavensis]
MVTFKAEIERFSEMGEKTGWTYIFIPFAIANEIKADCRKSYRVKGRLDQLVVEGLALVPMGEGDFIIALNGPLREKLKKEKGAVLEVSLEEDLTFKILMPEDLETCLSDEPQWLESFLKLPKSHQNYYINWLNSAKTEPTRTKRLVKIVTAMDKDWDFGTMMRDGKPRKE